MTQETLRDLRYFLITASSPVPNQEKQTVERLLGILKAQAEAARDILDRVIKES